jgi:hypothetical protein
MNSLSAPAQTATRQHMVVGVTASNMRSTPGEMKFVSYEIDENQLSQALFYESIFMLVALLPALSFVAFVLSLSRFLSLPFSSAALAE